MMGDGTGMKLEEKLEKIGSKSITILEFSADESQIKLVADFLKFKQKTDCYGVYLSCNRPTNNLIEKLEDYGYDLKKNIENGRIRVVDLMSKNVGDTIRAQVIYVSSASELSAIQLAIEQSINQIKGLGKQCWLLVDSLITLLVFNSSNSLLEFLHFLFGRLRVEKFEGIIFSAREGIDMQVISTIKQFCDEIIKI